MKMFSYILHMYIYICIYIYILGKTRIQLKRKKTEKKLTKGVTKKNTRDKWLSIYQNRYRSSNKNVVLFGVQIV